MNGKTKWFIADGFMSNTSNGDFVSHEAVCVLNVSDETAVITISVYFEDREPLKGFKAICKPERTNHIRLDKITNDCGIKIPKDMPYAIVIESNVPVICQCSRLDVSNTKMALMTTMAY